MNYENEDMLVREQDHVMMIRLKGSNLSAMHEIDRISTVINKIVDEGAMRLVVDFKLVKYVGSAVLGMMISLQKKMKERGGKMVISHPEHLEELLKVSKTAQLFQIAPDTKAAFKLLKPV
jgi:anti-anti-sigma factor